MASEVSTVQDNPSAQELTRELAEAREQQAASAEILRVLSGSPRDLRGVCSEIAMSAARLCDANDAAIGEVDGNDLHLVAHHGPIPTTAVVPLRRGALPARAALDRQIIHIPDLQAETAEYPEGSDRARRLGFRTILAVPLVRAGEAIGTISIRRTEVRPFTDRQIDLLKTFADQAAIAIENVRLFTGLEEKNYALTEAYRQVSGALERETATGEILRVIGCSPTDVQPVFETIARSCVSVCGALGCVIFLVDGGMIRVAATHGLQPERLERFRCDYPVPLDAEIDTAQTIRHRRMFHLANIENNPDATAADIERARLAGYRTRLMVPMVRGDRTLGLIALTRADPTPFPDQLVELLRTFADQAVIAIENTRLFEAEQASKRELQESLRFQTATAEVLSVISRSPNQLQPVLDAITHTAARLCQAEYAHFRLLRDGVYHVASSNNYDPVTLQRLAPIPPGPGSITGRVALERKTVHLPDILADFTGDYSRRYGEVARTGLGVPLLKDQTVVGVIMLFRKTVRPFTERQIALVNTFAEQALIAMENTRLFEEVQVRTRELTETLEQQTATADVLKVISRSTLDLHRALDALVESAARLCNAYDAAIFQVFDDGLRLVAHHGQIPFSGAVKHHTLPLVRGLVAGRAVIDRQTTHVADVLAEADAYPESRGFALQTGFRTALGIPLIHANEVIGVILIRRAEVRPFSERQIELVNTFADQAVIAIENTRLFEEVQARTRELAKTVEDLEIASQHKSQFVANMSHELRTPLAAILGYTELIQEGFYGPVPDKALASLTRIRSNGQHLLGLINTVLDIAKIESGQFALNMSEYAIDSVVETVRAATESLAQTKKLALKTTVARSLPIGLGDEQRLTQVLLNLVGNAIKFTDAGEVRVAATATNSHFTVTVADTGPGIPQAHQARIFEEFHQVDSSNTKAKGGTGLGLAIAKQILDMHGGRIWVESTLGKGSTFQMELPIRAEFRKAAS